MPRHDPIETDRRRSDQHVIDEDCYRIRGLTDVKFVVDVGVCYGSFIRHVRAQHPDAKVIGFEPNPSFIDLGWLKHRVAFFPAEFGLLDWVTIVPAAVSDKPKMAEYAIGKTPSCGGLTAVHQPRRGTLGTKEVHCVTLEPYILGRAVDILKLDCEGSEVDVLRGVSQSALHGIRYICGEYHGNDRAVEIERMLARTHAVELDRLREDRGHFFARRLGTQLERIPCHDDKDTAICAADTPRV